MHLEKRQRAGLTLREVCLAHRGERDTRMVQTQVGLSWEAGAFSPITQVKEGGGLSD